MAEKALVNPEIVAWARERSGYSPGLLARKLNTRVSRYLSWEDGQDQPTFKQAQKLANAVHIPFGYFFLPKPPIESLPIPDLRTVEGRGVRQPSPELIEVVRSVIAKQEWFKDYLVEQGAEPLPFVGSFNFRSSSPKEVVASICAVLEIQNSPELRKGTHEAYLTRLIRACEANGILVMRAGVVGANTSRKLNVSEFRGFAIADKLAPVIFINSADAKTARLFTLIHELAHLWIGSSGVSNADPDDQQEEAFCNHVSGEFLVPETEFQKNWTAERTLEENLANISSYFHVSKLVVARRALQFQFVSKATYQDFYKSEFDRLKREDSGGGDYYRNSTARNSNIFARAVLRQALGNKMLLRDAGKLLDISPSKIKNYDAELS